jgi:hypothetical protein
LPDQITGAYTNPTPASQSFYRVARTAVAAYDSAGTTPFGGGGSSGGNGILNVSPTNGSPGSTFTLVINLNSSVNPPPANAPINSVSVGSLAGTSNVHVSQTEVTSIITIPANAAPGAQTVSVVFPGPPTNPGQTVTYTLTDGFMIN